MIPGSLPMTQSENSNFQPIQNRGGYKMTNTTLNWLDTEIDTLISQNENTTEFPESLKLIENKITEVTIDFSKPFEKRPNKMNPSTKQVLMPCKVADKSYTFWLNVANPLYSELLKQAKAGKSQFKILRTGKQKDTRYTIVD